MKNKSNSNRYGKLRRLSVYSLLVLAVACSSGGDNSSENGLDDLMDDETSQPANAMPEDVLSEIIQRIPSPVEMVALIKASGAEYSESMLNSTSNVEKYTTSHQQAFNLGVYGADLGYINMYEKTISSLSYLNAVKQMADLIKVGQFFDFNTLKRLSSNKENIDSLLYITTSNFNKMDQYLREQGRADLSILSVAGAWLEGIYISSQVAKHSKNQEIVERIGEQKLALEDITLLLSQYSDDQNMGKIATEFNRISTAFGKVEMSSTDAAPQMKEVDGKLVVTDNSTSSISISKEALENIIKVVTEVRNKFIN